VTKIAIPAISGLPAPLQRVIAPIIDGLQTLARADTERSEEITTLGELLRGSQAQRVVTDPNSLPPVSKYQVVSFPNYIVIYINEVPTDTEANATTQSPGYVTELWRGVGTISADNAQLVQETTRFALEDHPPPGETYVYWLRFRSQDGTRTGPFSPSQGIILTTAEAANPELLFDPTNGGVFLETFEGQDLPSKWTRKDGGGTTIDYPLSGVVGGRVARIAGGEEWRVYNDRFEFDPSVLYRMKVGLRMSAAPSNGATSARAMLRAGFECYNASGAIVDTSGGTGFALAHFFCAYNLDYGAAGVGVYQEFEGYVRGLGAAPTNNADDVVNPSVARNTTTYFAPMFVVNYDDGNGTTELDYIRIDALTPYSLALSGILSNDSIALTADATGAVLSYANATGTFSLLLGLALIAPANVVFSIGANPQGLTATIDADGNYAVTSGFDPAEENAEITFIATFQGLSVFKKFNLSKAKQGTAGPPGTGVDVVTGSISRVTWPVLVQQDGTPISGAFTGAAGFLRVFEGGAEVTSSATFSVVATGCTGTINTDVNTPVNGQPRGYYQVTAMSADVGTLELTGTYGGFNVYLTFTVIKSKVGYEIVSSLPATGNYEGRTVFLTTDGKLYRYYSGAWTAAVAASEITGQLTAGQIASLTAAQITGTLVAAQIASITAPQITGTLTAAQIASINAATITVGQLTAAQIASVAAATVTGTLTAAQIASITAAQITGQIVGTQIADGSISTARLAAGAVTAATIAAGTITALEIAAGTITGTKIAAGTITASNILAGTITANEIAASTITGAKILAGSITANNIAAGTITALEIAAGTITGNKIAADTIEAANIAAGAITAVELAAGSVIAGKIAGASITATELAAGSVTAGQIAAGSVTTPKLAAGAVTANEIAANTIVANNIAAGAITTAKIAASAITTTELAAAAVTASKISVGQLSAIAADLGGITAGTIALNSSGHIRSGQTDFNTGIGFFLGWSGGVPKFSIGNPNGFYLTWDGTSTLSINAVMPEVTASSVHGRAQGFAPSGSVSSTQGTGNHNADATFVGGVAPITWAWSLETEVGGPSMNIANSDTPSPIWGAADIFDGDPSVAYWKVTGTDANGLVKSAKIFVNLLWVDIS
jgi:hypothetical protein